MKSKVFARLVKGVGVPPQLYVVTEEGEIQCYSDAHNGWILSGFTEKELKSRIRKGEFKEIPFK